MQNMIDFIVGLLSSSGNLIMQEPFIYFLAIIIMFIIFTLIKQLRR
jgi:hypothetical protein